MEALRLLPEPGDDLHYYKLFEWRYERDCDCSVCNWLDEEFYIAACKGDEDYAFEAIAIALLVDCNWNFEFKTGS